MSCVGITYLQQWSSFKWQRETWIQMKCWLHWILYYYQSLLHVQVMLATWSYLPPVYTFVPYELHHRTTMYRQHSDTYTYHLCHIQHQSFIVYTLPIVKKHSCWYLFSEITNNWPGHFSMSNRRDTTFNCFQGYLILGRCTAYLCEVTRLLSWAIGYWQIYCSTCM